MVTMKPRVSRRVMVVVAVTVLLSITGDATPAHATLTFDATAASDLVRETVSAEPALLVSRLVDAGALTAQAHLTSLGDSSAYASSPYPGELVTVVPGLASSLFQLPVPLPQYPLIASSTYPSTPHQDTNVATLDMAANSSADDTNASVHDGGSSSNASVTVDRGAEIVTATADATLGTLQVGSLISIGGVRTSARVTRGSDGKLDRASEFSIASINVLGQQVRLGSSGLELAGTSLPLGLDNAVDPLSTLLASLATRGVTIRTLDAQQTDDGIDSAGLQITQQLDTGINGIVATVTTTVGRLSVAVSGKTSSFSDSSVSSIPPTAGPTGTLSTGGVAPRPVSPSIQAKGSAAVGDSTTKTATSSPATALRPELADGGRFYPVLVLVAIAMAVVTDLFRKRGVRLTWLS